MTPARLTVYSAKKTLTKTVTLDADGALAKESAALSRGTAQQVEVEDALALAHLIDGLGHDQALGYGVTDRLSARIAPRDHLRPGEVSRSRENLHWPEGPGVMFLDLDGRHAPEDVETLRSTLVSAMPELQDAPQVWTQSSSGGIKEVATGKIHQGGMHCYVIVSDARRIPAIGQQLYDALWLDGHGHHVLSKGENPSALERCLVDDCAWQPERLDYAAAPILGEGLERVGGTLLNVYGDGSPPLDVDAIAPLTDDQQAAVSALKRESKAKARAEVSDQRRRLLDALPAEKRESQRKRWLALDRAEVTKEQVIYLEHGTITVAEILASPHRFHGVNCRDPQDPFNSKGAVGQARIYTDGGGLRIHSFAHGGCTYRLAAADDFDDLDADTVELAPEPSRNDIVGACYRWRAFAKAGALEGAAEEIGASLDHARNVWRGHLAAKAAPLHRAKPADMTEATFTEVADTIVTLGINAFCTGKLGSGKTKKLGGAIIEQAKEDGRPFLTVTVLRSLVRQHGAEFGTVPYDSPKEMLDAAQGVSTTAHSLNKPSMADFLSRLQAQSGVVLIDEAAAVADLLFSPSDIMREHHRKNLIGTIAELRRGGAQVVLLDGDVTPAARQLSDLLKCSIIDCTEQEHEDPHVELYPAEQALDGKKNVTTTPCHGEIVAALQAGDPVVLPTDSKEQAERLYLMYASYAESALCLHGDNAEEPEQARFLENPNQWAAHYQLLVYSPVVSVGVSVTSVEPHVFAHLSAGTLGAVGAWQLVRRFRKAKRGVVKITVEPHLCRRQCSTLSGPGIARDILSHAHAIGAYENTPAIGGMIACHWQQNIVDANPLYALFGHLLNSGIKTNIINNTAIDGAQLKKQQRDAVRAARIKRVSTAEPVEGLERYSFKQSAKATPQDQARVERLEIEDALMLQADDMQGDALPEALVDAALYDNLCTRARRLGELMAARRGVDLDDDGLDFLEPLGYEHLKHKAAQAALVNEAVDLLRDDSGRIVVTASKCREITTALRGRVHVAYGELSRPPGAKAPTKSHSRWVRDLLQGWGYECVDRERPGAKTAERRYTYQPEREAARFAERIARHLSASSFDEWRDEEAPHPAKSGYTPKPLEPAF